jgi:hypothetical protein
MNIFVEMILAWARDKQSNMIWTAWGYFLAKRWDMDPVDAAYCENIINQRIMGRSA